MGLRAEMGFALLAFQVNRALGGKARMDDFMPNVARKEPIQPEDLKEGTLDDVLSLMGVKNRSGKRS